MKWVLTGSSQLTVKGGINMEEVSKLLSEMNENWKIVLENLDALIDSQTSVAVNLENTLKIMKEIKND